MVLKNTNVENAVLVIEIYAEDRYHNGGGYTHHPAFRYKIIDVNGNCQFPDMLDLKMLTAKPNSQQAIAAATEYIITIMPEKIAQLIEGEFNGSA
jgi:hypothetical protein